MKINLGGGERCPIDWVNLDPIHGKGDWKRRGQDLPWPVDDNSVTRVRASHVMEHIPAGQDRIDIFNEVWRVLEPGGTFAVVVPVLLDATASYWTAIADPTHVSYWCEQSFAYFDGSMRANADYGIKLWKTIEYTTRISWEGHWLGSPVKDSE